MTRSRKDAWLRDEIILALDLYRREGRNPSPEAVAEVSEQLRSISTELVLATDPGFRSVVSVRMKVANLVALDPRAETVGMTRGSRLDVQVFEEFWLAPAKLETFAAAIRAKLPDLVSVD